MKNIYTIVFMIGMAIVFQSNSGGRGNSGNEAVTTAPGENGRFCGNSGCHSSGTFSPELSLSLIDSDGNVSESYLPGVEYTVKLEIGTTGNASEYGFQMVSLIDSDNSSASNWSNLQAGTGTISLLGRNYLEQKQPLSTNIIETTWTAPSINSGNVSFYAAGIAANGTGNPQGDGADLTKLTVQEAIIDAVESAEINLNIYPNPATDFVIIESNGVAIASYNLYDMNGRKVAHDTYASQKINLDPSLSGLYMLMLNDDEGKAISYKKLLVQ